MYAEFNVEPPNENSMDDGIFKQEDPRWRGLVWYHKPIDHAVAELTRAMHAYAENPGSTKRLLKSAQRITTAIERLQKYPDINGAKRDGSLNSSGCWHVSVANMLRRFNVPLNKLSPTPEAVVLQLRQHMLGTLTGYVSRPFVDPLSLLTKERVQLAEYRDFGKNGVTWSAKALRDALAPVKKEDRCAIVNVQGHEFLGREDSHYILVAGSSSNALVVEDPTTAAGVSPKYDKIYQISVYHLLQSS